MSSSRRREDRILDPSYLADLETLPIEELRKKKADCEELEAGLSYSRRLLHGRLDILKHEAESRASGGATDTTQLIEDLPSILAEGPSTSSGRLPRILYPQDLDRQRREVERLVSDATLAQIDSLSSEELGSALDRLLSSEREISESRRRVQEVMDAISAEIVSRYREGREDPSALLRS
ncbi:MAG: aerial mycelium formation protein [Candidatus Methylomirabilales bacterium]